MITLAIETSTARGSIACGESIGGENKCIFQEEFEGRGRHSEALFVALQKNYLKDITIDKIVVGLGPGSFSSIRVAIAAAHGIALSKNAKIYGVSSTWSVALQKKEVSRLGIFADAKRGEYYCTVFSCGQLEKETFLIPKEKLEEEMSKMTLAVAAENFDGISEQVYPLASDFLFLGEGFSGWHKKSEDLKPIYLREAV